MSLECGTRDTDLIAFADGVSTLDDHVATCDYCQTFLAGVVERRVGEGSGRTGGSRALDSIPQLVQTIVVHAQVVCRSRGEPSCGSRCAAPSATDPSASAGP